MLTDGRKTSATGLKRIFATLAYTVEGPTVTQFAIQPGQGVRVDRITSLAKDLQLALEVKLLRVFAPIPGEKAVGIQVANSNPQPVYFRRQSSFALSWLIQSGWSSAAIRSFRIFSSPLWWT